MLQGKRTGGRHSPCIFGTESESKKKKKEHRQCWRVIEGLRIAYLGAGVEWNRKILGKQNAIKSYFGCAAERVRTKLVPSPAGTTIGTTKVLCGGEGGKKRVKERTGSSYAEDARRENLEIIRRRRIWPEDAVNGNLSQQGVFKPTLRPSTRVPRRCAAYRIALLLAYQQTDETTNPRKKKRIVRVMGIGTVVPGGFQSKKNP